MPRTTYQVSTRPKRRIEQVYNHDPSQSITNAAATNVLHTAEDRQTLVRIVGKMRFQLSGNPGAGVIGACNAMLVVKPQGVNVLTPTTSQVLDTVKGKHLIADYMFGVMGTGAVATDATQWMEVDVDIKGQRILAEGDEVALRTIGNAASIGALTYNLTLIFKE